ncbi:MAG: succinate dehydrogenase assembly factor 2 [Alphaproteobacteria bacterium]
MNDPVDDSAVRRKRLRFRSWHRGTREMDILLGRFADARLESLSPPQLDRFETLLHNSDPDLFGWITGASPVPEADDHDVMRLLREFSLKT